MQNSYSSLLRILIAKADRVYAEALGTLCAQVFPDSEIEITTTGEATREALEGKRVDYLILGMSFPDLDGVDLLQDISQKRLAKTLIIIAGQHDKPLLPSLDTTRFDAIIDTYCESQEAIKNALKSVANGQIHISSSLRPYLVERHSSWGSRQKLTIGERRVLKVIGNGCDNDEAGPLLGLRASTEQTHRRSMMRKLRVSSSPKLVYEAVRLGFVQLNTAEIAETIPYLRYSGRQWSLRNTG